MTAAFADDLLNKKQSIKRSARLHWIHWFVVGFSLFLTLMAWSISKQAIKEKVAIQFDRQAVQAAELITERMRKYEDVLWGGVAAIQALGGDVSVRDWRIYADSLRIEDKYPGINGIGVIHFVPPDEMKAYLAEQRLYRPNYSVHPPHNRNEFWPITYIEPVAVNSAAVGLDMAHEANRYLAAVSARDTGAARITGPITLVQDANKTPGFLFYAPYYEGGALNGEAERKRRFSGLVYAPFVVKKLLEGTLAKDKRLVGIRITDGDLVLYDENRVDVEDYDPDPLYRKTFELDLYGRTWALDIRSALSFRQATKANEPIVILAGGIFIDALLLTLFILLADSNRRAFDFINKIATE